MDERYKVIVQKDNRILDLFEKWVTDIAVGNDICDFLKQNDFYYVGIYGYGYLGKALANYVSNNGCNVVCIVERNKAKWDEDKKDVFFGSDDKLPMIDVMIVTAICDYEEVYKTMAPILNCPILSMEDII